MKKLYLTLVAVAFATVAFAQNVTIKVAHPLIVNKAVSAEKAEATTPQKAVKVVAHKVAKAPTGNIIYDQPAGTLKHNLYGVHSGFYVMNNEAKISENDGMADDVVFAEDGSVYFKNPLCNLTTNTWLKGTLNTEGNLITVELPQAIYYQEKDPELDTEELTGYIAKMNMTFDESGDPTYVADTVDTNVQFSYENGVITLVNDNSYETILGLTDEDGSWYGYGDYAKSYEELSDAVVTPPAAALASAKEYKMIFVGDDDDETAVTYDGTVVKLIKDGDDIYLSDLGGKDDGVYIKGTVADNKLTIPSYQYLGVPEGSLYHLFGDAFTWSKTYWEGWGYIESTDVANDGMALDYDADTDTYTTNEDKILGINYGKNDVYTAVEYKKPVLSPYVSVNGAPAKPTITSVLDYGDENKTYTYGKMVFSLTNTTPDGDFLNPYRISYSIYLDDEVFEFWPDSYPYVEEEMSRVPYNFIDSWDIYSKGPQRTVYIYATGYQKVAIQEFYEGTDGVTYYSEPAYYYKNSDGIESATINDNSNAGAPTYYDLAGRRIQSLQKGVNIVRTPNGRSTKVLCK